MQSVGFFLYIWVNDISEYFMMYVNIYDVIYICCIYYIANNIEHLCKEIIYMVFWSIKVNWTYAEIYLILSASNSDNK